MNWRQGHRSGPRDRAKVPDGLSGPQEPNLLITPHEAPTDLPGFRIDRAETVRRQSHDGRGPLDAMLRAVRVAG